MILKRVLHPVGQGAFFTEQFKKYGVESPYLNVVYDCGSTVVGKNIPKVVKDEVNIAFDKKDHIDLLFVSHFDEDHTNGLNYLLDNTSMDKDTYAVLPFAYPYLIMLMDDRFPSLARFIRRAIDKGIRLIGWRGSNMESTPEDSRDIEPDKKLVFDKGRLFKVVDTDSKKVIWYFYPFMKDSAKSFQADFDSVINDWKKTEHFKDEDLNDANWVLNHFDELKAKYQEIGKKENDVTTINVNSLLMLSFPAGVAESSCFWPACGMNRFVEGFRTMPDGTLRYIYPYDEIGPTCLYTGDTVLADAKSFHKVANHALDTMIRLTGHGRINMMQIPHHGSKNCLPSSMIVELKDIDIEATFVNCNPYSQKTPMDPFLIPELTLAQIPLFLISDNYHSRVEVYAEV